jgi:hypothetical protein
MVEDVRLAVENRCPVHLLGSPVIVPTAQEVVDRAKTLIGSS